MKKYFILSCFTIIIVHSLKEENSDLTIRVTGVKQQNIGIKGTLVLECSTFKIPDDIFEAKRNAFFTEQISDGTTSHEVKCGFWQKIQVLYIFFVILVIQFLQENILLN